MWRGRGIHWWLSMSRVPTALEEWDCGVSTDGFG